VIAIAAFAQFVLMVVLARLGPTWLSGNDPSDLQRWLVFAIGSSIAVPLAIVIAVVIGFYP